MSVWFGPKVALSELSCSFGPGVTGLLGPNGAGKTTLMRSMTGLLGVNQGSVLVEGRDPRRDRRVHRQVALVPEDEAVPAAAYDSATAPGSSSQPGIPDSGGRRPIRPSRRSHTEMRASRPK